MVSHMKTTLVIDDTVIARLRLEAAKRGTTISALVEAALRGFLEEKPQKRHARRRPKWHSGGALVDIADRDALYKAMEGR